MEIVGLTVVALLTGGALALLWRRNLRTQRALARHQRTEEHLYDQTWQLHALLAEAEHRLKQLQSEPQAQGIFMACSHCGRVRDELGEWDEPSPSFEATSQSLVSHGVCPDCLALHYPSFMEGYSMDPDAEPPL